MESEIIIKIENIYKLKPYQCIISGKIKKCNEDLHIKNGQKISIQLGNQKSIGHELTYGHKEKQLKIGDYCGFGITSSDIDFHVGDELTILLDL